MSPDRVLAPPSRVRRLLPWWRRWGWTIAFLILAAGVALALYRTYESVVVDCRHTNNKIVTVLHDTERRARLTLTSPQATPAAKTVAREQIAALERFLKDEQARGGILNDDRCG